MLPSMVSEVMSRVSLYSCFLLLLGHVAAQNREYDDTDLDEGKPFNPTMVIVAVIIILVSLFLVFLFVSVCMQRCLELVIGIDGGPSVDQGNSLNMRRQSARGLDASVIETFPTFLYSTLKTLRIGKEALECPVCLSEFEDDETLRLIPQCYHVFHLGCIDAWLPSHATCPLCRANLVPVPSESVDLAGETSKNSGETLMDDIRCECNIRLRVSD